MGRQVSEMHSVRAAEAARGQNSHRALSMRFLIRDAPGSTKQPGSRSKDLKLCSPLAMGNRHLHECDIGADAPDDELMWIASLLRFPAVTGPQSLDEDSAIFLRAWRII